MTNWRVRGKRHLASTVIFWSYLALTNWGGMLLVKRESENLKKKCFSAVWFSSTETDGILQKQGGRGCHGEWKVTFRNLVNLELVHLSSLIKNDWIFQLFSSLYAKLQYVLNELNDKDVASGVERSSMEDETVIIRNLQEQIQLNKQVCQNPKKYIFYDNFPNLPLPSWYIA